MLELKLIPLIGLCTLIASTSGCASNATEVTPATSAVAPPVSIQRTAWGSVDGKQVTLFTLTNRHGLLGSWNVAADGTRTFTAEGGVFEDAWQSGYVDVDDLLASSDLGMQDVLVHFITERRATPNYVHRMGIPGGQPGGLDTRTGFDQEFQAAHLRGLQAELALLRDFFGDPLIQAVDIRARRFRSSRGDIIRVRITEGRTAATSGTQAVSFEVVLHDTHAVITAEEYLALLERERAAAGAAAGVGVP